MRQQVRALRDQPHGLADVVLRVGERPRRPRGAPSGRLLHEVGDAHVIRNAGGVVTEDTIRSLTISQHLLDTRETLLVHHTECGLQATDDVSFADRVEQATGRRPPWAARAFIDAEDDVRESMRLIAESPYLLSHAVRGAVYDVETGRLREVR